MSSALICRLSFFLPLRSDEVAHVRSEYHKAREESMRLGAAAEKRAALGALCSLPAASSPAPPLRSLPALTTGWSALRSHPEKPALLSAVLLLLWPCAPEAHCSLLFYFFRSSSGTLPAEAQIRDLGAQNDALQAEAAELLRQRQPLEQRRAELQRCVAALLLRGGKRSPHCQLGGSTAGGNTPAQPG
jgi:hypothetical protein